MPNPASSTSFRKQAFAAVFVALLSTPLLAVEINDNAKFNASSGPQSAIPWMSGGIGDDARDEMRKATMSYNVHIVFSNRQGSYLASIPFAIARSNGRKIIEGVSPGPLLYIQLKPGVYQVSAEIDGAWQSKKIQIDSAGSQIRTMFVSKGE